MNEREIWQECVNHCIKNEIIGFNLMFDEFLKMREKEGYKLVPLIPTKEMLEATYLVDDEAHACWSEMLGAVDDYT